MYIRTCVTRISYRIMQRQSSQSFLQSPLPFTVKNYRKTNTTIVFTIHNLGVTTLSLSLQRGRAIRCNLPKKNREDFHFYPSRKYSVIQNEHLETKIEIDKSIVPKEQQIKSPFDHL